MSKFWAQEVVSEGQVLYPCVCVCCTVLHHRDLLQYQTVLHTIARIDLSLITSLSPLSSQCLMISTWYGSAIRGHRVLRPSFHSQVVLLLKRRSHFPGLLQAQAFIFFPYGMIHIFTEKQTKPRIHCSPRDISLSCVLIFLLKKEIKRSLLLRVQHEVTLCMLIEQFIT